MKIAILNDTHCGIRNSSDIFMEYQEKFYRDVFFPYLNDNGIKRVLHLGDYYDNRKTVNFKCLNHNRKIFLEKNTIKTKKIKRKNKYDQPSSISFGSKFNINSVILAEKAFKLKTIARVTKTKSFFIIKTF